MSLPVYIDTAKTLERFGFAQGLGDILKHPADLDRYRAVIEATRPEVIVETGTRTGASASWFASQGVDVITVEIDDSARLAHRDESVLHLLGDSADPAISAHVAELVAGRRVMVSLDSDHTAAHVTREIQLYGPLVTPGCYLVVEDGIFRFAGPDKWKRHLFGDPTQGNPLDAVEATLANDPRWRRDIDIERMHPISHHPGGFWVKL